MNGLVEQIERIGVQYLPWSFMDDTPVMSEVRINSHICHARSPDNGVRHQVVGPGNFSQSSYSVALWQFLSGHIDHPYLRFPIHNANLLYYVCVYAYAFANLTERQCIAFVRSRREEQGDELYFCISFIAISRIIESNRWNLYIVQGRLLPPFPLQCEDRSEYPFPWRWRRNAEYTICIEDEGLMDYDENYCSVIFLSTFGETQVLGELQYDHDIFGIDPLCRLITSYIYHRCIAY
jgi:hypothetical protein